MTAKTLEQEAREAEPIIYYEEMSCLRDDFVLGTDQDLADAKAMIESIVARNVLSAATARDKEMRQLRLLAEEQLTTLRKLKAEMLSDTRDKEIEELQVELIDLRAVLAESKANYDKALYAIEAAVKIGGGHLEEIASLRARVKELEGMVPRWVNQSVEGGCAQVAALGDAKWKIADGRFRDAQWWSLMVPPIPLPEKKSTNNKEHND